MKYIYFIYFHRALICLAWNWTDLPEDGKLQFTANQACFISRISGDLGQPDSSVSILTHANQEIKDINGEDALCALWKLTCTEKAVALHSSVAAGCSSYPICLQCYLECSHVCIIADRSTTTGP